MHEWEQPGRVPRGDPGPSTPVAMAGNWVSQRSAGREQGGGDEWAVGAWDRRKLIASASPESPKLPLSLGCGTLCVTLFSQPDSKFLEHTPSPPHHSLCWPAALQSRCGLGESLEKPLQNPPEIRSIPEDSEEGWSFSFPPLPFASTGFSGSGGNVGFSPQIKRTVAELRSEMTPKDPCADGLVTVVL